MDRAKEMVVGTFYCDSLALASAGFKDRAEIKKRLSNILDLHAPPEGSLHCGKKRGQFTSLGDQQLALLEHLVQEKGFDSEYWPRDWQIALKGYDRYLEEPYQRAFQALEEGKKPGNSTSEEEDLSAAVRSSPLVWFYEDDLESLMENVRIFTQVTHGSGVVSDCARILARISYSILKGEKLLPAVEMVCKHFHGSRAAELLLSGLQSDDLTDETAADNFGIGGQLDQALPLVGHLLAKYPENPAKAYLVNIELGGDSASRGMALSLLLGSQWGLEGIDPDSLESLSRVGHIRHLLDS